MKPRLIVFDEPYSALDYPGVVQVLNQIIFLHKKGHTISYFVDWEDLKNNDTVLPVLVKKPHYRAEGILKRFENREIKSAGSFTETDIHSHLYFFLLIEKKPDSSAIGGLETS
jgi:ABC-type Mn2+/Zn2+ transport system ATPase subunit